MCAGSRHCGAEATVESNDARVCMLPSSPLLRVPHHTEATPSHTHLRVVWQVLVQVGQGVGVLREAFVNHPQPVAGRHLPALSVRYAGESGGRRGRKARRWAHRPGAF